MKQFTKFTKMLRKWNWFMKLTCANLALEHDWDVRHWKHLHYWRKWLIIDVFSAQGWELIMKENICNVHSTCVAWWISHYVTGQLISKGLFGILNSSKKGTKKFNLATRIPQVDLFSFVFWKNLKTSKRHFEINSPVNIKTLLVCNMKLQCTL